MLTRNNLEDYQLKAIDFIKNKLNCALFLKMGTGKTASSLTAISDLQDDFFITKTLVIAPLRVANHTWKSEIRNWGHLKDLKVAICTGSEKERLKALKSKADIYCINRENVKWLIDNFSKSWKWDSLIIDESTSFKKHNTQRFKYIRKVIDKFKIRILLTGTPCPNGYLDLWSQLYLLDKGERLGRNITIYKQKYFIPSGFNGYQWKIKDGAESEIKEKIKDICFSTEPKSDRPKPRIINEYVDLTGKIKDDYKQLEKEYLLTLEKKYYSALEKDKEIVVKNAATLGGKLLQYCNGALYDENKNWHAIHDLKFKALKDIIEDNPNESFLIAHNFKFDLIRLKKLFPYAEILSEDGKEIDEWNNKKIKILLAHPASCGHGLNLQEGGFNVVWFGLNWSLELYEQFNARLDRKGQKDTVNIIHILLKGGLDEKVLTALNSKAVTQDNLVKFLVDNYANILK